MTGKQLKAQVLRFTNDEMWSDSGQVDTDKTLCDWVTSALAEYPPEAFNPLEYIFDNVIAGVEYSLPEDFLQVTRYIKDNIEYWKSDLVVTTDTNTVVFPENIDSISMFYYAAQEPYTSKNEEIPLRLQFHNILYYYLISMYYAQSGEGDTEEMIMSEAFRAQYNGQKNMLLLRLDNRGLADSVSTTDALPRMSRRRSRRWGGQLDEEGFMWLRN